jgi:hypothetical protein
MREEAGYYVVSIVTVVALFFTIGVILVSLSSFVIIVVLRLGVSLVPMSALSPCHRFVVILVLVQVLMVLVLMLGLRSHGCQ